MEEIGEKTKALPNMFASGVEGGFSNRRCLQQTRPSGWLCKEKMKPIGGDLHLLIKVGPTEERRVMVKTMDRR